MPSAAAILSFVPPWFILTSLLGVLNGAACFVLIGRRVVYLAWYVVLGALAAAIGQVAAEGIALPAPIQIGEVNLLAASLAAWLVVAGARLKGL